MKKTVLILGLLAAFPALAEECYFSKLGPDNVVEQVVVVNCHDIADKNGVPQEGLGITYLRKLFGENTVWLQTFADDKAGKNSKGERGKRLNYAGKGYKYDPALGGFVEPKPEGMDSWTLDQAAGIYKAPVERPKDGKAYQWSEEKRNWIELAK